jgi:transposase
MVYVGVDLHRKRSHVVALDDAGAVMLSQRVDTRPHALIRVFGELEPAPIGSPSKRPSGGAGSPICSPTPASPPTWPSPRHQGHLLRAGEERLRRRQDPRPPAPHPLAPRGLDRSPKAREARRLARMRNSLVRIRSRLKCQVHVVLAEHGVLPEMSGAFGRKGRRFLDSLELPDLSAHRIEANLRLVDAVSGEIVRAERELRDLFRGDHRIRRLTAIPGIGLITAATVVSEVAPGRRSGTISCDRQTGRHANESQAAGPRDTADGPSS